MESGIIIACAFISIIAGIASLWQKKGKTFSGWGLLAVGVGLLLLTT